MNGGFAAVSSRCITSDQLGLDVEEAVMERVVGRFGTCDEFDAVSFSVTIADG